MRNTIFFGLLFFAALSFAACGHSHDHDEESHDHTEQTEDHDHDHDGHDHDSDGHTDHTHEGHDHVGSVPEHEHGATAEYTSAWVCPMHCEGSGSDEQGKCPVCGMDYVRLEEHVKDGHTHEK